MKSLLMLSLSLRLSIHNRPGATRGHFGAAPPKRKLCSPKRKLCSPKRGLCTKELNRLGVLECKSRPKLVFATGIFVIFVDWHRISWHIWDEDLFFFLEITRFRPERPFKFVISAGKSFGIFSEDLLYFFWWSPIFGRKKRLNYWFQPENPLEFKWRPFFLEITRFRPWKTFEYLMSTGKYLRISVKTFFFWRFSLNFWSSLCSCDPDWDKFLVPPCTSRIHIYKLLVPPQNLFLPPPPPPPPPVTLFWHRTWYTNNPACSLSLLI